MSLTICHISDTHMSELELPEADILVHSGDYSFQNKYSTLEERIKELQILNEQLKNYKKKFKKIIYVPGNHDFIFELEEKKARIILNEAAVLIDEGLEFEGIRFYGTPSQPPFCNWAFNHSIEIRQEKYKNIPSNTDVLITHCPPYGILDELQNPKPPEYNSHVGCLILKKELKRIKPKVHLFGHIHEAYGMKKIKGITYSNGSIMNLYYSPRNKPRIINIRKKNENITLAK